MPLFLGVCFAWCVPYLLCFVSITRFWCCISNTPLPVMLLASAQSHLDWDCISIRGERVFRALLQTGLRFSFCHCSGLGARSAEACDFCSFRNGFGAKQG